MAESSDRDVMAAIRKEPNSAEKKLLDDVQRLDSGDEQLRSGMSALHLHFSLLRMANQKQAYMQIAEKALGNLVASFDVDSFRLANNDTFLICKNIQVADIDMVLTRVRDLFVADPLMHKQDAGGNEAWVTWYDLESDFEYFKENVVRTSLSSKRLDLDRRRPAMGRTPIDPGNLDKVARAFTRLDILPLMKKQSCVHVRTDGSPATVLFEEFYVSIGELAQITAPDVDLFSSPWLFQHLTLIIDQRLLQAIRGGQDFNRIEGAVSLNMNLQTLSGSEFIMLDSHVGANAEKVVLEIQPMDIFADMEMYINIRDWLQSKGYRILIDGLDALSLDYFDPALFDADFYKIAAGHRVGDEYDSKAIKDLHDVVESIDPDKVILSRVDSEEAIRFGLKLGISRFQGFFIDDVFLDTQAQMNARSGERA